ncbi:hypothetical protein [Alteriqipengyuania lutimaris]|uniref:Uncharacterized protein n=1 Tax=Alteriqipengyuania lutimaris TaxID=1538146 RepID=A0A395LH46_9SPHN|nr:hypothetical protein [Alteriqipengyuania lutimaris]MBB3034935.1 hypothetical protein [Alteriqipengyuania lutimaris]RDS76238.1 hypothetical protein DL238_00475 [Alteriqipengyuania lutimaris]
MATADTIPAWIVMFLGIYSFAAAMGELRMPGTWNGMLTDFETSPGMRFIAGIFTLTLGACIYLITPWRPEDWLFIAVAALGGLLVVEGIALLAAGERFVTFARWALAGASEVWAGISAVLGAALIFVALSRLETF